ncbi:NAD-dependent epimerase/dehydratase family protein [Galbibacter orientalis]|nr:NAD-dependent epimerase/dehydratase family protein [Galbibacter orientalis]
MAKILITGSSGFFGRNISEFLQKHHSVIGLSRTNSDIKSDLKSECPKLDNDIDYVIHAAGKAHIVPKTEEQKLEFFDINVTGTKNLLKALEGKKIKSFIFISTVAVYGLETGTNIKENYPLNGDTPYAMSKIEAEEITRKWSKKKKIPLLILRLPLIVGDNPPGNLGAMIKAIKKGYYFSVNKGRARRSMVMVADIAKFIGDNFEKSGIYNLTDDYDPTFHELEAVITKQLGKKNVLNLPSWGIKYLGLIGDKLTILPINSNKIKKMSNDLTFDCSRAKKELNWTPSKVVDKLMLNYND